MSKKNPDASRSKKTIRDHSLTKSAYLAIKNDIMLNRIKPGDRLSGCQLAKRLNMSRTPVREAIGILENEGFVETRNGVGILVKETTEKDIADLVEVRTALECSALESGSLRVDRAGLEKLLNSWERMKADFLAGEAPDLDIVMDLDYETHDFLVNCSRNAYLIEMIKNVSVRFRRLQILSVMALGDLLDTIEQHLVLLRRIQDGSLEEAVRLLKIHIKGVETYVFHRAEPRPPRKRAEAGKSGKKGRRPKAGPPSKAEE